MDGFIYHRMREKSVFPNEAVNRSYKRFAIIVLTCTIYASIFVTHNCYSLENNEKAGPKDKLTFAGNWDEDRAVKIVTDICDGWLLSDAQGGYAIKSSLAFQRNNINKKFFQISANGESCRFCPGLIGAVIFSELNGTWEVEFEEEDFANFGVYGVPPEAKLIKIGAVRHGLLFQWWRNVQLGGGSVHYVALIDLGDKGYPLILGNEIYQEVTLDPLIPKLEMIPSSKSELYNIKINSKIYKFKRGKYEALSN